MARSVPRWVVSAPAGEPQNLLIATVAGWDFQTFFLYMAPITMPVLACGLITCVLLEVTGWFGYGALMPENVRQVLTRFDEGQQAAACTLESQATDSGDHSRHSGVRTRLSPRGGRLDRFARDCAANRIQRDYG